MVADVARPESARWFQRGVWFPVILVLAAAAGVAVRWVPPVAVGVGVVAVVCVLRFGLTTTLLHGLVVSMFFESVAVGPFSAGRLMALVVPAFLVVRLLAGWRPARLPRLAWVPALLYLTWSWASGLWAGSFSGWLDDMGGLGLAAAYFLAFAMLVTSPAQLRQVLRSYVLGALVLSLVALAQAGAQVRAVGFQGDPNIFALYQVAAIPAAGMLSRTTTTAWLRAAWLLPVVPLVASVVASQSRGGLLTLAVLLPVGLARGDFGRLPRGHGLVSAVMAAGLLAGIASVASRYANRLSFSAVLQDHGTGRLDIWHAALTGYARHPVLGLGGGGFQPVSGHLLETTPGVGIQPFSTYFVTGIRVHNMYVEALTELGPIGLLLWLAILVSTVVLIVRVGGGRVRRTPTSPLLLMLASFAVATVFLSVNNNKMLWMVVGLAAAAATNAYAAAREAAEGVGDQAVRYGSSELPGEGAVRGARTDTTPGSFPYSSPAAFLQRRPRSAPARLSSFGQKPSPPIPRLGRAGVRG